MLTDEIARRSQASYRELYHQWEREQWQAGAIDLTVDVQSWPRLDAFVTRRVTDQIAWRRERAARSSALLVALADAAPTEEQHVFLTTQLADEARQLFFFDRVAREVLGRGGDDMKPSLHTEALLNRLEPIAESLRGLSRASLARATAVYQLGILGVLEILGHDLLVRDIDASSLPGIRQGLELSLRDAHRHLAFGLHLLRDIIEMDLALAQRAGEALEESWPFIADAIRGAADPTSTAADLDSEVDRARTRLQKLSAQAGIELRSRD